MSAAESAKDAALIPKAGAVPTSAIAPPATAAARICTRRPVDQDTELAASRWPSLVTAGMTALWVGLKKTVPIESPPATRYA